MNPDETARETELFFKEKIPLTRAMGVRVVRANATGLTLEAPVALNYNHLHTAFGGSINALATLAGYGALWLALRDESIHVVIAESSIRFLRPIHEIIRAECLVPESELDAFCANLATNRKARIRLMISVRENGEMAAEFSGAFVALRS